MLRAGRYRDRIPVATRFPAPFSTSPGTHPVSCTAGTGSFTGVKQPGRDVNHPPHTALRLKTEYSPLDLHCPFWDEVHQQYSNILIYIQQDATLHSLLFLEPALHVSGGSITHHQERKQLYLQHLVFVTPLLVTAAIMEELEPV